MAAEGLLSGIMKNTPLSGMGIMPTIKDQEVIIEMTTDQLSALLLKDADARAKNSIMVEIHEGKITLRIKLF
jgi:hypothetical protein